MATAGGFIMMTTDMGIDALRKIPRRYVNENLKATPTKYTIYMNEETTDEFMLEWEEMGGFGDIPMRDEGDYLNFARPDVGNIVRIQPEVRQLAFAITERDRRFNKTNKVKRASEKLAQASRRTMERLAAAPLNEGFASTRLGADGQPLFSDSHVLLDGSTFDNKATVDLTTATLEDALVVFSLMRDNDGTQIDLDPKYLVVHPAEYPNALRILNAQHYYTGGVPSAADTGVPNKYIQSFNLILVKNPYLTDTDAWFLLADKSNHGLVMVINEKFHDKSFVDEYTDDYIYSVQFAAIAAHTTWFGAYGSTGAG